MARLVEYNARHGTLDHLDKLVGSPSQRVHPGEKFQVPSHLHQASPMWHKDFSSFPPTLLKGRPYRKLEFT
eukprot:1149573-Pelagomonas_calceolata.AAC.3